MYKHLIVFQLPAFEASVNPTINEVIMQRVIVLALLLLSTLLTSTQVLAYSNITQQQAAARAEQIADVNYQLSLELKKGSKTFKGSNQIDFTLRHLRQDVVIDFSGKQISAVSINGQKITDFSYDAKEVGLVLPKGHFTQGLNRVTVDFVVNYNHEGVGLHQFIDPADGNEYLHSNFEPASAQRMFPAFDQPNLKAVFRFDVKAPVDWQVISNEAASRTLQSDGQMHSWFKPTQKIPTYIFHLSAGAYAMWADDSGRYPMRVFARQSLAQYVDEQRIFETTKKGMVFFEQYYDYKYPFGKYDQIFAPEFNEGAMENAGAVVIAEFHIFRSPPTKDELSDRDNTILHEMAHMWFGNIVTMDWWDGLWLNESFAEFMGYEGLEGIGQPGAWVKAARDKTRVYREDQMVTTHPVLTDVTDTVAAIANFNAITYGKGLSALRQLVYLIGADTFKQGLRLYFKQHAFGNTTLEDFIAALETAYGQKLTPWVDDWLGTKDVNSMKLNFSVDNGKIAGASVTQSGGQHNPILRSHVNQIGLFYVEDGQLQVKDKIKVTFAGQTTLLPALNGKAAPAMILPNVDDYDYIKVRLDDKSLTWFKAHWALVKDPATKALVWGILWDMVRDQEMRASDYIDLAMQQIALTSDVDVVDSIIYNIGGLTDFSLSGTKWQHGYRQQMFNLAKARVNAVKAESDLQQIWYDTLVDTASNEADLQYLIDLYDGKQTIKGIKIHTKRRWSILQALAAGNKKAVVESRLSALSAKDTSARGRNELLTTQASYPDKSTKQQIWANLAIDADYSAREKKSLMRGLYNIDNPQLAELSIKPYFDMIEAMVQAGSIYEHTAYFIYRAFPTLGGQASATASEHFLKTTKVPQVYKKQVMRRLDALQRSLKIRAANEDQG
ncbi:MAG: aminopeptidase N [Phenylobacterium sp.]